MTRKTRRVPEATKQKISNALKGKVKTEEHKQKIAESLRAYWATIPKE